MNINIKKLTKSFSYTFIANLLSMSVSVILVFIIPGFIGVEQYGYWQLYLFYVSYIAYMSLGLTDGAYLRYGGYKYSDLKKDIFVTQYWFLVVFDILINTSIVLLFSRVTMDVNRTIVIAMTCLTGIIIVPRSLLTFMLQATNRIKEYSIIVITERLIYFIITVLLLFIGVEKYYYLIAADLIGRMCSNIYAIIVCKELVFGKLASLKISLKEISINVSVGIKLLIANLASMLIIGIIRVFIENNWGIETFGKVSLTLSVSNMLMLFINSIAIVMFPMLRRLDEKGLQGIYQIMRDIIMLPLLGLLIFYYPIKIIFSNYLPQYNESLRYMALLFPMCIYESKMVMLVNTYFKTLRREKLMLKINVLTLLISMIITWINVILLNNLNLTILSIVFILAFRCIIAEIILSKIIAINILKDIVLEACLAIIFMTLSWKYEIYISVIFYLIAYIGYLMLKKKDIKFTILRIKAMTNEKQSSE